MPADEPLVSVVLPTYNVEAYLRAAVQSVLGQTYANWELIVIDDGSTDETRAYLEGLTDDRVHVLRRAHCGNPARVRNDGLGAATGEYVAFLDSDDVWCPEKLATQLADLLEHPECGWSYTFTSRMDERGEELRIPPPRPVRPIAGWIMRGLMTFDAAVATPAVVARRDLLTSLGGFDETFFFCEDYEMWARLAMISQVTVVSKPLARVRSHGASYTFGRVEVWEAWVRLYGKLAVTLRDPTLSALARARRNDSLIHLASRYRLAGRYRESLGALWRAAPRGMTARRWWAALVKGVVRPLLPARPR